MTEGVSNLGVNTTRVGSPVSTGPLTRRYFSWGFSALVIKGRLVVVVACVPFGCATPNDA